MDRYFVKNLPIGFRSAIPNPSLNLFFLGWMAFRRRHSQHLCDTRFLVYIELLCGLLLYSSAGFPQSEL
jgi:hypothetical protein